jgi:hypothetical protein
LLVVVLAEPGRPRSPNSRYPKRKQQKELLWVVDSREERKSTLTLRARGRRRSWWERLLSEGQVASIIEARDEWKNDEKVWTLI